MAVRLIEAGGAPRSLHPVSVCVAADEPHKPGGRQVSKKNKKRELKNKKVVFSFHPSRLSPSTSSIWKTIIWQLAVEATEATKNLSGFYCPPPARPLLSPFLFQHLRIPPGSFSTVTLTVTCFQSRARFNEVLLEGFTGENTDVWLSLALVSFVSHPFLSYFLWMITNSALFVLTLLSLLTFKAIPGNVSRQ